MKMSDHEIRLRRKAMLVSIGGAAVGAALIYVVWPAIGVEPAQVGAQVCAMVGLFASPLAMDARPETHRHTAILVLAAMTMPLAASAAFGAVLIYAPPNEELASLGRLAVPLLASFAALLAGLASWFAVRLATRRSSLWRKGQESGAINGGDER